MMSVKRLWRRRSVAPVSQSVSDVTSAQMTLRPIERKSEILQIAAVVVIDIEVS